MPLQCTNRTLSVIEIHSFRNFTIKFLRSIWILFCVPTTVHFTYYFQNRNIWRWLTFLHSPHSLFIAASTVDLLYSFRFTFSRLSYSQFDHLSIFLFQRHFWFPLYPADPLTIIYLQYWLKQGKAMLIRGLSLAARCQLQTKQPCNSLHIIKDMTLYEYGNIFYFCRARRWAIHVYSSVVEIS